MSKRVEGTVSGISLIHHHQWSTTPIQISSLFSVLSRFDFLDLTRRRLYSQLSQLDAPVAYFGLFSTVGFSLMWVLLIPGGAPPLWWQVSISGAATSALPISTSSSMPHSRYPLQTYFGHIPFVSGEPSANKFTLNLNVVRDQVQVKPKPIIRFRKIPHKNFIFVLFLDLCVLDLNSYVCFWHVERPSRGGWQEGLESSQELPIFPPTFIPWFGQETFHRCSDFDFSPIFVLLFGFRCD